MSDKKKLEAKKQMLEKMSKDLREKTHSKIGDSLKDAKLSKVTVMAKDEKGLAKGLSKAEEILKAKFGDKGLTEDEMEESDEELSEYECPACDDEGCSDCLEE